MRAQMEIADQRIARAIAEELVADALAPLKYSIRLITQELAGMNERLEKLERAKGAA